MKKLLSILIIFVTLTACSLGNDTPNYHYEVLPVDSFTVPTEFKIGETYVIKVKYKKPSDCFDFDGFFYEKKLNTRTIAVQAQVLDNNCVAKDIAPIEVSFNFYVTSNGSYIFKFYKGEDVNGNNIFEDVEIPVTN